MRTSRTPAAAAAALSLLAVASCAGSDPGEDRSGPLTMWVRASTAAQSQALVDAWNAQGGRQVALTVVPTESYLQKVGVAAGSDDLPCVLATDVAYMPDFIDKGLFRDITDRVEALPFADALAPSHVDASTVDGSTYGVPHNVAVSAVFQNDVLLERAGVDPDADLESLEQLADNARAVAGLGGDVTGLYYTGNNAGSITFTHFPAIWASGGEPLSQDGTASRLDSPESVAVFETFNELADDGTSPRSVQTESGATRDQVFATGDVGYMLASNSVLQSVEETDDVQIGVQGIPGAGGGRSAFVGGDAIGVSASCGDPDAAWDFLEWSLGEEAQVGVFAADSQLVVRTDLLDNEFAARDPRVRELNELVEEGRTPYAPNYAQTFNDPLGPALAAFQGALFGPDASAALREGDEAVTNALSTS